MYTLARGAWLTYVEPHAKKGLLHLSGWFFSGISAYSLKNCRQHSFDTYLVTLYLTPVHGMPSLGGAKKRGVASSVHSILGLEGQGESSTKAEQLHGFDMLCTTNQAHWFLVYIYPTQSYHAQEQTFLNGAILHMEMATSFNRRVYNSFCVCMLSFRLWKL